MKLLFASLALVLAGCSMSDEEFNLKAENAHLKKENAVLQKAVTNIQHELKTVRSARSGTASMLLDALHIPNVEVKELEACKLLLVPEGKEGEFTYDMLSKYADSNELSPYLDKIFTRVLVTMIWCFENT